MVGGWRQLVFGGPEGLSSGAIINKKKRRGCHPIVASLVPSERGIRRGHA